MEEDAEEIKKRKDKLKNFFFGWVKDNYDLTFLAILILAFIFRFLVFLKTMNQAVWWDAADYLATAKNWAGANPHLIDTWYYRRGFLWPLLCAVFFKFGLGELGIRFFVILLSTGVVATSYFLVSKMFDKKLAILTSLGLTFSWIMLFFSGRPLTNLPATFFLLISLLFLWKGYVLKEGNKFLYLFGLFFALSCLTRMQYLMFALPMLVLFFLKEKFKFIINKKLWITLGVFFLVMLPYLFLLNQHFGNPFTDLTKYYLGVGSSQTGEVGVELAKTSDLFLYFNNLPYILDGNNNGYNNLITFSPIYLLFVIGFFSFFWELFLGFDKIFKNENLQKKLFILVWIISTFLLLGYIAPQLEQRYIIQTLPFLFLIAVHPFKILEKYLKNFKIFKSKDSYVTILLILILILLLLSNFSFGNSLTEAKKTSYEEVKMAGEWIKEHSKPEDIIISSSLPQITYYSERTTYPFNLAYRRDITPKNISETEKFILKEKPSYMVLSIFESIPDFNYWASDYPTKNKDFVIPIQAYTQEEQPILIIYQFDYSNLKS